MISCLVIPNQSSTKNSIKICPSFKSPFFFLQFKMFSKERWVLAMLSLLSLALLECKPRLRYKSQVQSLSWEKNWKKPFPLLGGIILHKQNQTSQINGGESEALTLAHSIWQFTTQKLALSNVVFTHTYTQISRKILFCKGVCNVYNMYRDKPEEWA